jgi:hypothetical protein
MKSGWLAGPVLIGLLLPGAARAQDFDSDGVANAVDNCQFNWNPAQGNVDGDFEGDACDFDLDGDGASGDDDNCPFVANPAQTPGPVSGIGAACPAASLPLELTGRPAGSSLFLAFELDAPLPLRPEIVVDVEPASAEEYTDLQVVCRGADEFDLISDGFGFLGDYALKIDDSGRGVLEAESSCGDPQPSSPGTWVVPLFLLYRPEAFDNPGDPFELACFVALRHHGPPPPGGTFDVSIHARTRKPAGRSFDFCDTCDDGPIAGAQISGGRDYTCFTPDSGFTFIDRGDPSIGQCSFNPPNPSGSFIDIQYAIVTPNRWDCCIWQHQNAGVTSERGFSNFWTGSGTPGARPDSDLDGILQRCDNCATIPNAAQRDADSDGPGDFCDLCPFDPDPANGDLIPAGNACQCSDVDAAGGTNLVDVVHIARFLTPAPDSPAFDPARCRVSAGLDPIFADQCGAAGLAGLRLLLARGDAPVELCD